MKDHNGISSLLVFLGLVVGDSSTGEVGIDRVLEMGTGLVSRCLELELLPTVLCLRFLGDRAPLRTALESSVALVAVSVVEELGISVEAEAEVVIVPELPVLASPMRSVLRALFFFEFDEEEVRLAFGGGGSKLMKGATSSSVGDPGLTNAPGV